MALNLSPAAVLEKNKLSSDGAWLILLEVVLPQSSTSESIRLVRDTTNLINWNGHPWYAFPFELDDLREDSQGELPALNLKISNVNRLMQQSMEQHNGLVGATVILRVIHSKIAESSNVPEIEETFTVQSSSVDSNWATFTLGADLCLSVRFPGRRVMKDYCQYPYKGIECGYDPEGPLKDCNRTLADCKGHNNERRFGGEPAIPQGGLYASNR